MTNAKPLVPLSISHLNLINEQNPTEKNLPKKNPLDKFPWTKPQSDSDRLTFGENPVPFIEENRFYFVCVKYILIQLETEFCWSVLLFASFLFLIGECMVFFMYWKYTQKFYSLWQKHVIRNLYLNDLCFHVYPEIILKYLKSFKINWGSAATRLF